MDSPLGPIDSNQALAGVFAELVEGPQPGTAVVLNSGDAGLLRSLATLSAQDASRSANQGATIAAHAQHVRFGLSLLNRWAREGGDPFADAKWEEAWKVLPRRRDPSDPHLGARAEGGSLRVVVDPRDR